VTFLFTDVQESTRLLQQLGGAYVEALAEQRRILRAACAAHGGVEVDTQGDAFFLAFARASDALSAAVEAQRSLRSSPLAVRMGLHTGEPIVTDEGYVGLDVHLGARVAEAGHGGQVLLSEQTARLLIDVSLRDLGEHRLKDLAAPQRLYQFGDADFPPVRTLHTTNLPIQSTLLIGRSRELAEVTRLVRAHRLVSLVGPGGSGKTASRSRLQPTSSRTSPTASSGCRFRRYPLRHSSRGPSPPASARETHLLPTSGAVIRSYCSTIWSTCCQVRRF
jgi:hypothetical protein